MYSDLLSGKKKKKPEIKRQLSREQPDKRQWVINSREGLRPSRGSQGQNNAAHRMADDRRSQRSNNSKNSLESRHHLPR